MKRLTAIVVGSILWGFFFGLVGATLTIIGLSSFWLFWYLDTISPLLAQGIAVGVVIGIVFGIYTGLRQRIDN